MNSKKRFSIGGFHTPYSLADRHVMQVLTDTAINLINVSNHIPTPSQVAMQTELNELAWKFAELNVTLARLRS